MGRRTAVVRATLIGFGAAGLAAGVYFVATVPPTPDSYYPKCVFHQLTGWHCPGCGTGRATHAILNGRVLDAASQNVYAVAALPFIVLHFARSFVRRVMRWPESPRRPADARWIWLLFATIIAFWILRNVPVYPFTLLAPHEL